MPPVAVTEFQDALAELAARSGVAAEKLVGQLGRLSAAEARAFITDAYPELLTPYLAASSNLTAQWYAEQPVAERAPGSRIYTPEPAPLASAQQLGISGRWALAQGNPATAIQGSSTRHVLNASRQTVTFNARAEGVRWVRQAKADACGFCRMLATRSVLQADRFAGRDMTYTEQGVRRKVGRDGKYTGEMTLTVIGKRGKPRKKNGRKLGSEYHDHCRCTAVPLRDGIYEAPDYVHQWTDDYIAAFDKYGSDGAAISRSLDLGRIRPDRIRNVTNATEAAVVAETAAVSAPSGTTLAPTDTAPAATDSPTAQQNAVDLDTEGVQSATVPVKTLKRYSQIDPYDLEAGASKEEIASSRKYQAQLEEKIKRDGLEAFKNLPTLSVGADGQYAVMVDGNHRLWAAGKIGLDDIQVTVITGEDSAWAKEFGFPLDAETRQILTGKTSTVPTANPTPPKDKPKPLDTELARQTGPTAINPGDKVDQLLAEANQALEAGDFDRADVLFGKAEKAEVAQKAKAERAAAKQAALDAADSEKQSKILSLIEEGYTPVEAESEVYGVTVESLRRRDFINNARADGHTGKGFDELLASVHADFAAAQFAEAEDATRGVMLKRKYIGKFDPSTLWNVTEATARKVMSEEMAGWFDDNGGRVTRSMMKESILEGRDFIDMSQQGDFLQ